MKKTTSIFFLLVCLLKFANAQTQTVYGNVKDESGNTVSLAFVQDKSDKTATRTDSLGRFTLKANPNATLLVSSAGYQPKLIDVKGKTDLTVVLNSAPVAADVSQTPGGAATTTASAFNTYGANQGSGNSLLYGANGNNSGTLYPVFSYTEATRGSRYLFNDWVSGFVVSPQDSVYKNPKYGFNYDKIAGELLLTSDKHQAIAVDKERIKSFTLYDQLNTPQIFEYVPEIDKVHFAKLITGGKKYKIYKLTKTRFVKNNYHSDGMTSTGNNYDEFEDEDNYYVISAHDKKVQPFSLKNKSIKTVFAGEGDRVNTFFSEYPGAIDEAYLKNMNDYMNQ
jgi:hypothetical protein